MFLIYKLKIVIFKIVWVSKICISFITLIKKVTIFRIESARISRKYFTDYPNKNCWLTI